MGEPWLGAAGLAGNFVFGGHYGLVNGGHFVRTRLVVSPGDAGVRGDGRRGCPGRSGYGQLTALLGRPTSGDGTRLWRVVWNVVRVQAAFCVWTDEKRGGKFEKKATLRPGVAGGCVVLDLFS